MTTELESLTEELRRQGPRNFAAWNAAAFDTYVEAQLTGLAQQLAWRDKNDTDRTTPLNFLNLIYEGVGAGWLQATGDDARPTTFLAHCVSLLPYHLANTPRKERGELLTRVWNLAEGLAREPQWLNQIAIAKTDYSVEFRKLDKHLATVLAPVLSPLPPADWKGGLRLSVLNLREQVDDFLPGRIYLASPAVLCVEDRLRSEETLAILLQKGGQSEILGSVGRLPEYAESFAAPQIETQPDAITINGRKLETPLLNSPRPPLCVASGFVAIAADDSQRLWLAESS